jgi:tellurite methyltransferase
MQRPIVGYHLDAEGDWVAELSCGHGQHVRHRPPFTVRQWVVTPEGRESRLGQVLDCPWCDRWQMPSGHVAYRKTPVFTLDTIPKGLLSKHTTKAGVWGRLEVLSGNIAYVVEAPVEARHELAAGEFAVIVPELEHRVEARGPVEFCVELYRAAAGDE